MNDAHDVLKAEDIASILRISRSTAYKLIKMPGFPRLPTGSAFRVTREGFWGWATTAEWRNASVPPSPQPVSSAVNGLDDDTPF